MTTPTSWIVARYTCVRCGTAIAVVAPEDGWRQGQTEFQRLCLDHHGAATCLACTLPLN